MTGVAANAYKLGAAAASGAAAAAVAAAHRLEVHLALRLYLEVMGACQSLLYYVRTCSTIAS